MNKKAWSKRMKAFQAKVFQTKVFQTKIFQTKIFQTIRETNQSIFFSWRVG
jgi:hypothetical protein